MRAVHGSPNQTEQRGGAAGKEKNTECGPEVHTICLSKSRQMQDGVRHFVPFSASNVVHSTAFVWQHLLY